METFRALLAVDAREFSRHRDVQLPELNTEIWRIVEDACERGGIGPVFAAAPFRQDTGDGLLAILPLEAMAALADSFPRHLQNVLDESAPDLRTREMRLRLRAALHVGLVDDRRPRSPGVSTAVVDVCRLLDARPLRDALTTSDPDVTYTAFLYSAEVFANYVRGGRTGLRESQFAEVGAKVKQFDRPAYLYVPKPSRRPDPGDSPGDGPGEPAPTRPGAGPVVENVRNRSKNSQVFMGNMTGGSIEMNGRS
ncbi:hypothetical protein [Actinomadura atramentaria]|uniref:hypothetical protein n=1 Tax=Actinomadura atramentaria TaxID=1990 RepID=UPI00037F40C8|nr:hypothetical protein [Actinomadura atramentaria]